MVASSEIKTRRSIARPLRRRQSSRQPSKGRSSRSYTLLYSGDQSPNELVEAHFRRSLSGAVWADLARSFPLPDVDEHFTRSLLLSRSTPNNPVISPQVDGSLSRSTGPKRPSSCTEPIKDNVSVEYRQQLLSVEDHFFKSLGKEWLKIMTHNLPNDYP